MDRDICSACGKPLMGTPPEAGGPRYCADCQARVDRDRGGLWWASLVGVVATAVFVAVVALLARSAQPSLQGSALLVVSVLLALVPALIWMAVFYLQDVREPEPKRMVLGVFVLAALLARAVGIPLVEGVFQVRSWLTAGVLYHILGAILIIGFTEQFLIYAAVRYSVYPTSEFDERVDGIIYGTAAGLGYASLVNVQFVVQSGGLDLTSGAIRVAVTALALASFGGLSGYFLGRCKFDDEPIWWMPAGLALAATLNGLFVYFLGEVSTTGITLQGGTHNPWPGLILGTVVAALTFAVLFYLIRRLARRAPQAVGA
ncbi:MAG: PrsW family intramembrane metalloprotease [Anaerolineae bacterium]|nr:PrsW family intramembrane metalloprotease [Anaerolineae bacterium]